MPKPNVLVICPPDHYALRGLDAIRSEAEIFVSNNLEEVKQHAPAADIILNSSLTGKSVPLSEIWPLAKQVRWVHSLSAGVENLLFPELIESPVPVTNARGVFKHSLAEFAILGMLYFLKNVPQLIRNKHDRKWEQFPVDWLEGRIMGVLGYGEIGRECAIAAKKLGVKIYALRRRPEKSMDDPILDRSFPTAQLKEMLSQIDVLLVAAPLTPDSRHLMGEAEFQVMKPNAIVINIGRGPVIDEAALIQALNEKWIAAAALDVFEQEPLSSDHPFYSMDNVLISPHCADRTRDPDWLDLAMQRFVENFRLYLRGEQLTHVVDKKAGY